MSVRVSAAKHIAVPYPNRADYALQGRPARWSKACALSTGDQINTDRPGRSMGATLGTAGGPVKPSCAADPGLAASIDCTRPCSQPSASATIERVFEALASNAVAQLQRLRRCRLRCVCDRGIADEVMDRATLRIPRHGSFDHLDRVTT
jgi:hypothetical protein